MGRLKLATYILRAIPGVFFLNSGVNKLNAPDEVAGFLHSQASVAVPPVAALEPKQFTKLLAAGEIGLAGALLAPFVPNRLVGLGLTGFGASLLSLYFRDPANTEDDGIRPSHQGIGLAKDSWLVAIGLALMLIGGKGKKAKKA